MISAFRGLGMGPRFERVLSLSGEDCGRLRAPSSLRGCHAEIDDLGWGFQYCLCIPRDSVMLCEDG